MDPNRRHNLYRPQIPADPLRGNPCDSRDPRRCVPPLKGLGEPRAASGSYQASVPAGHACCRVALSYRALSPGGETLPCGIKGAPSVLPKPIPNSKFLIPNWSFTFSAKEKDVETGLSYFGSRYYSSDLCIWLSVDPQSDKYPSLSPYVYCADNPVKLVDPNGEEIIISLSMDENGNRIVNISFTATLANKTSHNISAEEMEKYKNDIIAGIKKTFDGRLDDGTKVNLDVDISVLAKDEMPKPFTKRHEINIVDELVDIGHTAESIIGGGYMNIRLDVCRGELEDDPMDRSAAHEFGHLLGLDHVKDENNIMNPDTKGRLITGNQILEACGNFFNYDINRGIPHLETLRKLRIQANTANKHH